jgi:hypothetical protein
VLRFLVFGVDRTCAGLAGAGVFEGVGEIVVVHSSVWMDSVFGHLVVC